MSLTPVEPSPRRSCGKYSKARTGSNVFSFSLKHTPSRGTTWSPAARLRFAISFTTDAGRGAPLRRTPVDLSATVLGGLVERSSALKTELISQPERTPTDFLQLPVVFPERRRHEVGTPHDLECCFNFMYQHL